MRFLKKLGSIFWRFMIIFSFIVNIILVIVLIGAGILIFEIKNQVAEPLIGGLHSSFVGLDQSTIDWTIPVRDSIPVRLDIPLQQDTVVTLTEPVPLQVSAIINLPGVGVLNNAIVNLQLPQGLELPVSLDLMVPVDQPLDIELDVRAVIPIAETQLHDPIDNLRLLFDPLIRPLTNLPSNFTEAREFAGDILTGEEIDLLAENDYTLQPWSGYSRTAGVGYELTDIPFPPENVPLETGLIPLGGIPILDELIRPEVYENDGSPSQVNQQARTNMTQQGIAPVFYDGSMSQFLQNNPSLPLVTNVSNNSDAEQPVAEVTPLPPPNDAGIISPTPAPETDASGD